MIPISDDAGAGTVLDDGSPVYEVGPDINCRSQRLTNVLKNHRRVLLYLGFDAAPTPSFDHLLLNTLAGLGGMTAYQEFGQSGLAAVFDLTVPGSDSIPKLNRAATFEHVKPRGCVGVRRARRW